MHKLLAKNPTHAPSALIKSDGTFTQNATETAKLLLDTHFPGNLAMSNTTAAHDEQAIQTNINTQPTNTDTCARHHKYEKNGMGYFFL